MPSDHVDPELMIEAILMSVEDMEEAQAGTGDTWLKTEFDRVRDAYMQGAKFCTSTTFKGTSHTAVKEVPTAALLAVLTQARRRIAAQSGTSTAAGAMFVPRLVDFPLN